MSKNLGGFGSFTGGNVKLRTKKVGSNSANENLYKELERQAELREAEEERKKMMEAKGIKEGDEAEKKIPTAE